MDNNVQTFIEKTLNIDELLKNSSDVTALYKELYTCLVQR